MNYRTWTASLILTAGALAAPAAARERSCAELAGLAVPTSAVALPHGGVTVASATPVTQNGTASCRVLGQVEPVDPKAPPVRFQVNLPDRWNGKALQYGGGGLNGTLITGLAPLRDAPPGPTPLEQGYVTFGTDAGHVAVPGRPVQEFALNREALENHAFAAYKKLHDVARFLVRERYGRPERRMYFFGGSEGGREAMLSIQHYPGDYDGVVAVVPAISWLGVALAYYEQWRQMRADAWLSPAALRIAQQVALDACDARDGLKDGIIMRYRGCDTRGALAARRCPNAAEDGSAGQCLTDRQIALFDRIHSPFSYGFAAVNGETAYPAFPSGGEANPGAINPWLVNSTPPAPGDRGESLYSVGIVRYFVTGDPNFSGPLVQADYRPRLEELSRLLDMTDPDLSRFKARGGKLILKENGADFLVSPQTVFRYYDQVRARFGPAATDGFIRFYVSPWMAHGAPGPGADGKPVPSNVDLLARLDDWVEGGRAPAAALTVARYAPKTTTPEATLPLCSYPAYPHYVRGPATVAASYECRRP